MIPGLTARNEARLLGALDGGVTRMTPADFAGRDYTLLDGDDARRLGVEVTGPGEPMIVVTDPDRPVGRVQVLAGGRDPLLFFDNAGGGTVAGGLRLQGDDAVVFFNAPGTEHARIGTLLFRSHQQFLYWGRGATAVDLSIELEGTGCGVVVGDDSMLAGEVWIRNHDMHATHDLASGELLSRAPVTTVLERHVWLGQGALLLSCTRVGAGSIVGARSLVKGRLPGCVAAVGSPARVVREGVSWGRSSAGMTAAERALLDLPEPVRVPVHGWGT